MESENKKFQFVCEEIKGLESSTEDQLGSETDTSETSQQSGDDGSYGAS
jgi:hypothetical protein